ncbi:MAG: hypothetical protein ABFD77_05315, partial [Thermotogota bacterium]
MAVESRLQLQPYDTTVRYYVDGTNGLDGALGTSWATAWKTLAFAQSRIEQILATNPGTLRLDLWLRGAFANEDLTLAGALAGTTTVNVIHHVDDWTEVATGTLTTVAATTLACGLREMTFTGFVLDATYQGRWIFIEDGTGKRYPAQILRVNGATAWINVTSVPAWVIGGDVLTVSVREPSITGIGRVYWSYARAQRTSGYSLLRDLIVGIPAGFLSISDSSNMGVVVKITTAALASYIQTSQWVETRIRNSFLTAAQAQEYGLVGTNTADTWKIGSWFPSTTPPAMYVRGGVDVKLAGYFAAAPDVWGCNGLQLADSNHLSYDALATVGNSANTFLRGSSTANHGSVNQIGTTSFVDLPAAGVPSGLVQARKNGWAQLASTVDGNNTGAGANLYGCKVEKGGRLQMDSCPTALTGDDGDWYIEDGEADFSAALTIAARAGGGPDIYVGANAKVHFAAGVTKSATNPSGGGTAQPVLQCRRGAKVTQAAGSTFTLPAGSGDNTTDYGANGAIDLETLCDVALGLLAGGNAIAANTAVRVK